MLPGLTEAQVERFAALGENGWARLGAGDYEGAEVSFRGQLEIFRGNSEPFVSLAMLEAARGSCEAACEHLREAVLRGFTDMRRLERAEAWTGMRGDPAVDRLREAIPVLSQIEAGWAEWGAFRARIPPPDLATVVEKHDEATRRVAKMAPALGERLARLWNRMLERTTASLILAHVQEHPDAEDLEESVRRLFDLYAGGPLAKWDRADADSANRLAEVARIVLERYPESDVRPSALVARASAWNLDRDRKDRLTEAAREAIRRDLAEVLDRYADHEVASTAAIGLVRVEYESGNDARAKARFRSAIDRAAGDPEALDRIRDGLGAVALLVGGVPEFRAETLNGDRVDQGVFEGSVVVVDFWATWCGPCLDGMETLREIGDKHGDDVALLGVNLDDGATMTREDLAAWIAGHRIPGDHLHDGRAWESEIVRAFGVREIPFTVVVSDGEVVAVNDHGRDLERAVRRAVRRR